MTASTKVKIEYSAMGHRGIGKKFLVRGMHKRAIIVVVRPLFDFRGDENMVVYHAAKEAAARNWKVVYVDTSDFSVHTVCFGNAHEFHQYNQNLRFLCDESYPGDDDYLDYKEGL